MKILPYFALQSYKQGLSKGPEMTHFFQHHLVMAKLCSTVELLRRGIKQSKSQKQKDKNQLLVALLFFGLNNAAERSHHFFSKLLKREKVQFAFLTSSNLNKLFLQTFLAKSSKEIRCC